MFELARRLRAGSASLCRIRHLGGPSNKNEVPLLYNVASIWAGWIQANSDDFMAIAELGRVKALMQRVVELDGGLCERERAPVYGGI